MADWVLAAERAYVAAATGGAPASPTAASPAHAFAAAGAVSSHHLAVGSPRSFGILFAAGDEAAAALSLTAHRTWFAPRDVRCATSTGTADALAATLAGRATSLDEALACDIVCVHTHDLRIAPHQLRRGTHLIVPTADLLEPDLLALAAVTHHADLPALAAGFVDGRQLDEITIFIADASPIDISPRA
jgi:ornithine cyclodeaminase/alanine dehydrogenase-like protein (mu-crystallin family)